MPRSLINYLYDKMLAPLGLVFLVLAASVNFIALLMLEPQFDRLYVIRQLVVHSRNVVDEIQGIQLVVSDAERAQLGFLYTDNIDYLAPLSESERRIPELTKKLAGMVADNPAQTQLAEQLGKATNEKLADLQKTVAVQQMGQKDAARTIVSTQAGKQLMAAVNKIAVNMMAQEEILRRERVQI